MKRYTRESILAPLFKMLEAMFDLLVPIVVARMINQGIAGNDRGVIFSSFGLLVALAAIGLTCSVVAQYFAAKSATGCARRTSIPCSTAFFRRWGRMLLTTCWARSCTSTK